MLIISEPGRNVWLVWRNLLEESNALALSRLRASDAQIRLSNDLKPLKAIRTSVNKRTFEQLKSLQGDLAACLQEMIKAQKVYSEEEKQARDLREKALIAEEKIRHRSTNIFNSMAHLHKTYAKASRVPHHSDG
ncbi:unnamed protein product [Protopolystoma xenopodis]|uniref:Uncharacterized protein n=1 Tax=Protopolystoma xenopodis TaxID=117903 RepID=A0A448WWS7_9PLAT|nr:unnamed protein product [Protopolystoma xenopodis]